MPKLTAKQAEVLERMELFTREFDQLLERYDFDRLDGRTLRSITGCFDWTLCDSAFPELTDTGRALLAEYRAAKGE